MDRTDVSFWPGIASFGVSGVLGIIKGVEFVGSRRMIFTATARLTGSEDIGNDIVLNKSSIPATISCCELAWTERRTLPGRADAVYRNRGRNGHPIAPVGD